MTTNDMPQLPPSPTSTGRRLLRRSRSDRVGAGVAGGLGTYFGLDPVLFRVLFATAAFFGGAGILAYLLAWAAIPEEGTERAPIDGWVGELRRRHIPVWVVAVAGLLVLWAVAFSWWIPGPFFPVVAIAVILIVVFGRREWQAAATTSPMDAQVNLTKDADAPGSSRPSRPAGSAGPAGPARPTWVDEARAWMEDSRARHRARSRRARPVKLATLGGLVVALGILAIVDSVSGVQIQTYFWTALAIVVVGLLVGMGLRRTPWSMATLLPLIVAGCLAFAGTPAQFGDGIGQKQWRPTGVPASHYDLTFGQGILDLRAMPEQAQPRTIHVRLGAGQVKIITPADLNVTVHADVHIGQLHIIRGDSSVFQTHNGIGVDRTVGPSTRATGTPLTVDVEISDGQITLANS